MSSRLRPAGSGSTSVSSAPPTEIPAVSSSVPRSPRPDSSSGNRNTPTNAPNLPIPAEIPCPVARLVTGNRISAGIGKFGAFVGVFLFPLLESGLGLRGTLLLTAGISVGGALLTLVLPEPAGRSLEDISGEPHEVTLAAEMVLAEADESPARPTAG